MHSLITIESHIPTMPFKMANEAPAKGGGGEMFSCARSIRGNGRRNGSAGVSLILLVLLLAAGAFISLQRPAFGSQVISYAGKADVAPLRIGVLVARTGSWSSTGEVAMAAIKIAANDFHRLYAHGSVEFVIEDTASNPERALRKLKKLVGSGIRVIVGPFLSSEIALLKPYADSRNVVLISPASTAPSLAEDDNIFRLALNDTYQAAGIAELMARESISCVVPVYADDVYGNDLRDAFERSFFVRGGEVASGVAYDSPLKNPAALVERLRKKVVRAVSQYGKDAVAVLMISYDESAAILRESGKVDLLGSVRWFGTDSSCQNPRIFSDKAAAAFAGKTGFTASIYDRDVSLHPRVPMISMIERLKRDICAELSSSPNSYAVTSYDAVMLAGFTAMSASRTKGKDLKTILKMTANKTWGFGQPIHFDQMGDVKWGEFGFYKVGSTGGIDTWNLVAAYHVDILGGIYMSYREYSRVASSKEVTIGALLPLTGAGSQQGRMVQTVLQEAMSDANDFLGRYYPAKQSITLAVEDTQSDPAVALDKLRLLKKQHGIRLVIGPFISDELKAVMSYADANDIIIVSPTSTESSLAAVDNTFRLYLNENMQAYAISMLMDRYKHQYVIPVFMSSSASAAFVETFRAILESEGKKVAPGIAYDRETANYASIASDLAARVKAAVKKHGKNKVSVLLVSYEEVSKIFHAALKHTELSNVRWYGVSQNGKYGSVLEDPSAVSFARKSRYLAAAVYMPTYGVKNMRDVVSRRFMADLRKLVDEPLDARALVTYDSLWLCLHPYMYLGWDDTDFAQFKKAFIATTKGSIGYLGFSYLDEYGDRGTGSIGFFSVESKPEGPYWKYTGECYFDLAGPVLSLY
jgi:branched-chain amino acid transport system substrate-binding protein